MDATATLTRTCLGRSIKLRCFSQERGSYFDYADVGNLGLYVHVPEEAPERSRHRRLPSSDRRDAAACRELLVREIEAVGSTSWRNPISLSVRSTLESGSFRTRGAEIATKKRITTLHFGGSTAQLFDGNLVELVQAAERHFEIAEGIGFELQVADATQRNLRALHGAGVRHLVIMANGIYDASSGSASTARELERALATAGSVPFETVSAAFAFGARSQTVARLQQDIDRAFACGANHASIRPCAPRIASRGRRPERGRDRGEAAHVAYGCSATAFLEGRFEVAAFSLAEYAELVHQRRAPAALTLKFVERERVLRFLAWANRQCRDVVARKRPRFSIARP
ncbi:hypothetical protein C1878_00780 [Gordonibacter sp. 28C]|uniref:hypothetical protein n=1 Tax=Gordonibacter sp. 28C TaxID=2078569 RepID=UPI000DF7FFFB|nr:hypothetical protein [Gordonibacter sp. 28C]RDB64424.1 hypothetical protein C1878_00780 [Gordonibacter sp. 28C]